MNKPVSERKLMVEDAPNSISKSKQCRFLGIHRSGLYYKPVAEAEDKANRLYEEQQRRKFEMKQAIDRSRAL